jgi:hypothetical protein
MVFMRIFICVDNSLNIPVKKQQRQIELNTIDCACVIHGNLYPWEYVERLYHMIQTNLACPVRFHVFTEHDRPVPATMIKHILQDWPGIAGRKEGLVVQDADV